MFFYEVLIQPAEIFSTEAVALSSLPAGDARIVARRLDLRADHFHAEIAFHRLERLSVFFRAYSKDAAGAVLWIGQHPVATLGLFDHGDDKTALDRFHQSLTYLAARETGHTRVIAKRKLPKLRPALFVIPMNGGDGAAFPTLHAFIRALMAAFLDRYHRSLHEKL